jgi:hypothetical protein
MSAVPASQQHTAGWCAYGRACVVFGKSYPFFGQLVKIGRFDLRLPIATQFPVPQIIRVNVNNVGFARRFAL